VSNERQHGGVEADFVLHPLIMLGWNLICYQIATKGGEIGDFGRVRVLKLLGFLLVS